MQRAPFTLDGGVTALHLLDRSAACLEAAGDGAAAARVRGQRARWHQTVSSRYQALQLRLQRAKRIGDRRNARDAARRLRAMVGDANGDTDGEYARYLRRVEQGWKP